MVERRQGQQTTCETLCSLVVRLDRDINGDESHKGLVASLEDSQEKVQNSITDFKVALAEMRGSQTTRDRITFLLLAALATAVFSMAVPSIAHAIRTGDLALPRIFFNLNLGEVYAGSRNQIDTQSCEAYDRQAIGKEYTWTDRKNLK